MASTRDEDAKASAGIMVSKDSAAKIRLICLCMAVKPPCEKSVERRCLDAPAAGTWPAGLHVDSNAHLLSRSRDARHAKSSFSSMRRSHEENAKLYPSNRRTLANARAES